MIRKAGSLLMWIGWISLGWLIFSLVSDKPASPVAIIGVFALGLGYVLTRRRSTRVDQANASILPSQRRQRKEHKSWITKIDGE